MPSDLAPAVRKNGPLTRGGGQRVDRETGRAIAITRRLGARLIYGLRRLEVLDGEVAALLRGVPPDQAKGMAVLGQQEIGAAGIPGKDWIEAYKEYNKALIGYLGERRRYAQATKGGEAVGDAASDSEAIIEAILLATPEERAEAERRLVARAKDGAPP